MVDLSARCVRACPRRQRPGSHAQRPRLIALDNFGAARGHEGKLITNLGAERDRELLERVVDDLHASYVADRLDWNAREIKRLLAAVQRDSSGESGPTRLIAVATAGSR